MTKFQSPITNTKYLSEYDIWVLVDPYILKQDIAILDVAVSMNKTKVVMAKLKQTKSKYTKTNQSRCLNSNADFRWFDFVSICDDFARFRQGSFFNDLAITKKFFILKFHLEYNAILHKLLQI